MAKDEQQLMVQESNVRQTAGRRAWHRLRVYVDEQAVKQRHNSTAMNWRFIRQTLDAISQLEQSRTLLYQRYIDHPDEWLRGFINRPTDLPSQRQPTATSHVSRKQ